MRTISSTFSLLLFSLLFFQNSLSAQELAMRVTRCTEVSRDLPIRNIFVDSENTKWVGYDGGMYKVRACDFVENIKYKSGKQGAASIPSGNSTIKWNKTDMEKAVNTQLDFENGITAVHYNEEDDLLWVGTKSNGIFVLKTFPDLKLVESKHTGNTKMKSNRIESIFQSSDGTMYIGTDEGILRGSGDKWGWEKNLYNINRILEHDRDIWILSDGDIWVARGGRKIENYPPFEEAIEGSILDITFDQEGFLYIISQSIARCDVDADSFEVYGQFQDYLSQYATCAAADADGGIWVGTRDKGVYFLEKNSAITINMLTKNEPTCTNPTQKADISLRVTGGTEPFKYAWSTGKKTESINGLAPGIYEVTLTDAEGRKKSAKTEIADPSVSISVATVSDESGPNAGDGKAEASATGGKPSYSFVWDNGEKTETAKKLSAGTHSVTVTDRNSCTAVGTVNLSAKAAPIAVVLKEEKGILCAGANTGALSVHPTGGTAPFQYKWNKQEARGDKPQNLPSGAYEVTITDADGTVKTASIELKDAPEINLSVKIEKPATTGNSDGVAIAKVKGGTGDFSIKWDNEETGGKASKLGPGNHTVVVTDANGCTTNASFQITENILPLKVDIIETRAILCAGEKRGAVAVEVVGGKEPYEFSWGTNGVVGDKPSNLGAGRYEVTITDGTGSSETASIKIKDVDAIEISATVEKPASTGNKDGQAKVKAKGGSGGFTYYWDNGETTPTAKALGPGTHSVTVSDYNKCKETATVEISENILKLQLSLEQTNEIKCGGENTGALSVQANGGKPPYTYAWNESSLYGQIAENLAGGTYEITLTDAAGTTATAKKEIKGFEKLTLIALVEAPASTGNQDGKATVTAKGGAGDNVYAWTNGETTATAIKLGPGNHTVTVTDKNGCTATSEISVNENILPLNVELIAKEEIKCHGETTGSISVSVGGGKGPYSFKWNSPYAKEGSINNLPAGEYILTLTDAAGTEKVAKITMAEPAPLAADVAKRVHALNENAKDGKVLLSVTGGTEPYSYAWDNGETTKEAKKLPVGTHSVTINDVNGCTATVTCEIRAKILPDLSADLINSGSAVRMESLNFDADSTNFREESLPVIDEVYEFLIDNPSVVIEVGGHTNNIPTDAFCDKLSSARAKSVADYIVAKGIDAKRVFHKGYGKRKPFTTNKTPLGRKKNQRVEIRVLKIDYKE